MSSNNTDLIATLNAEVAELSARLEDQKWNQELLAFLGMLQTQKIFNLEIELNALKERISALSASSSGEVGAMGYASESPNPLQNTS